MEIKIPESTAGYKVFYGAEGRPKDLLGIADVSFDGLNIKMNFRAIHKYLSVFITQKTHPIELRTGVQYIDALTGERKIQKVRIVATGSAKIVALGKFAIGEGSGSFIELEIIRFTMLLDDIPSTVIDKINNICMVDGVDMNNKIKPKSNQYYLIISENGSVWTAKELNEDLIEDANESIIVIVDPLTRKEYYCGEWHDIEEWEDID